MSILVGYIPTPPGEAAARVAIAEARLRGERLLVLNSVREGSLVDAAVASPEDLDRIAGAAREAGVEVEVLASAHRDDVTDRVLGVAEEHGVSMIVIGLRQRSQVGKFIMGSHAQRILLQAERPVLAVKSAADGH